MILPMLRTATAAGLLAVASVAQAATPISLPLGNIGVQLTDEIELPVPPPPPRVARPDVSQFRLVVKPLPRGCEAEERRPTGRRQAALNADRGRRSTADDGPRLTPVRNRTPVRTPASSRLG